MLSLSLASTPLLCKIVESKMSELEQDNRTSQTSKFTLEQIRNQHVTGLEEYWDSSLSYADNLKNVFDASIVIPDQKIQQPILLAYACIPSALASVIPILFLHGREGSGKSQAVIFFSAVHAVPIFLPNTTYAAMRNNVQNRRWIVPKNEEGELNYCCCFDNLNRETLLNENLKTFFLGGYNRRTDRVEISNGDGTNSVFRVFGPKVISTIWPIYSDPTMGEFNRRLVTLKFKRIEELSPEDLGEFDVYNRLDLEICDTSLLNHEFNNLWGEDNQHYYMELTNQLKGRNKTFKIPKTIKSTQWALMPDLIASGIIAGVWRDINDAIDGIEAYWNWHGENIAQSVGAMQKAVQHYLDNKIGKKTLLKQRLNLNEPIEIPCSAIKEYLDGLARAGALESHVTPQAITSVMSAVGWSRQMNEFNEWVWRPSA